MRVFISWSGNLSFEVAKVLREWIPCVIQDIEPYVSAEDIDKGARWITEIGSELEKSNFGILCVTKENLNSNWLNFEAGALSKAMDVSLVCPLLFNLQPYDVPKSPITQFQMTKMEQDDIFKLFKSMNSCLGEKKLSDELLKKMFELSWDKMLNALNDINIPCEETDIATAELDEQKEVRILEEMLDLLRKQERILNNPEKILPRSYLYSASMDAPENSMRRKSKLNEIASRMENMRKDIDCLIEMSNNKSIKSELDSLFYTRISDIKSAYDQILWTFRDYADNE